MTGQNENSVSDEARKKMDQIESESHKHSRFIKLQSGEIRIIQFDPGKFEIVEDEFQGKKTKRVHYTVIDRNLEMEGEKLLPMSLSNSTHINELLKKGFNLLEIKRIGSDRNTRYIFIPTR